MSARHANGRDSICCDSIGRDSICRESISRDPVCRDSVKRSSTRTRPFVSPPFSYLRGVGGSTPGRSESSTEVALDARVASTHGSAAARYVHEPRAVVGLSCSNGVASWSAQRVLAGKARFSPAGEARRDSFEVIVSIDRAFDCADVSANDRRFNRLREAIHSLALPVSHQLELVV